MLSLRIYHRIALLLIILLLIASTAFGSAQIIICGWQAGEIYLVGFHSSYLGYAGFYYSSDYGETIELRDSIVTEDSFGGLLTDADENTIHRLLGGQYDDHLLSQDGGFSWDIVNDEVSNCGTYATGIISGEIYRKSIEPIINMEYSFNYGSEFTICSTLGFPDTLNIYTAALGSDSGEVYIWTNQGHLYYSSDYAEHFTYLGNLNQSAGIMCYSQLTNGAEPGEIYVFYHDYKKIWRIYDYGASVEVIANFPHGISWYCSIASGREPGEVYFYAVNPDFYPGGVMEIWHTNNYGQSWDMYEHVVQYNGVEKGVSHLPSGAQLQIYPNPANPTTWISFTLSAPQKATLAVYNMLGVKVTTLAGGLQEPGVHTFCWDASSQASGVYVVRLETVGQITAQRIVVLR